MHSPEPSCRPDMHGSRGSVERVRSLPKTVSRYGHCALRLAHWINARSNQSKVPWRLCIVIGGVIGSVVAGGQATAASKDSSWADPNFVLCEGIGASGTGRITARAAFSVHGNVVEVSD